MRFFKKIIIVSLFTLIIPFSTVFALGYAVSFEKVGSQEWLNSYAGNPPNGFHWHSRIQNIYFNDGPIVEMYNWVERNSLLISPTYRHIIPFDPSESGSPTVSSMGLNYGDPKEWNIYYIDSQQSRLSIDYNKISNNEFAGSITEFPFIGNQSSYAWHFPYDILGTNYSISAATGRHNPYNGSILDHGPDFAFTWGVSLPY